MDGREGDYEHDPGQSRSAPPEVHDGAVHRAMTRPKTVVPATAASMASGIGQLKMTWKV